MPSWQFDPLPHREGIILRLSANYQQGHTGRKYYVIKVREPKKKPPKTGVFGGIIGGDWGTRTLDLMRVKHAL